MRRSCRGSRRQYQRAGLHDCGKRQRARSRGPEISILIICTGSFSLCAILRNGCSDCARGGDDCGTDPDDHPGCWNYGTRESDRPYGDRRVAPQPADPTRQLSRPRQLSRRRAAVRGLASATTADRLCRDLLVDRATPIPLHHHRAGTCPARLMPGALAPGLHPRLRQRSRPCRGRLS